MDGASKPLFEYKPEGTGLWLLGFQPAEDIARWQFMSGSKIVMGDIKKLGTVAAVSALVRASINKNKWPIVRWGGWLVSVLCV